MTNKRVMIVDPSMYNRMVLNNILATNGYSVCFEASSGKKALANYEKARPDLVLVEAQMPELDGISTIRELCGKYNSCQAVLLVAAGQRAYVGEAMNAGAVDFIVKPLNDRRVVNTLKKL